MQEGAGWGRALRRGACSQLSDAIGCDTTTCQPAQRPLERGALWLCEQTEASQASCSWRSTRTAGKPDDSGSSAAAWLCRHPPPPPMSRRLYEPSSFLCPHLPSAAAWPSLIGAASACGTWPATLWCWTCRWEPSGRLGGVGEWRTQVGAPLQLMMLPFSTPLLHLLLCLTTAASPRCCSAPRSWRLWAPASSRT